MAGLSVAYAAWSVYEGLWLLFPVFVLCMLVAAIGAWHAWRQAR